MDLAELKEMSSRIRCHIINMVSEAGSGHPGGSLSMVELLVVLYFHKMNIDPADPKKYNRDRFVLSKGHAAPCLYAVLAERGFFDSAQLKTLRKLHSTLQGHPDAKKCPGVEASTGSLGQGISIAAGMALGSKLIGEENRIFTICGDGEMQEGLVWEAAEAAAHYHLDNLTVIIDNNGLQIDGRNEDVMDVRDLCAKFRAFGFDTQCVQDGNDLQQVIAALDMPNNTGKPRMILAHTVKGKGVSFMENQAEWHGKAPNAEQCAKAIAELEVRS